MMTRMFKIVMRRIGGETGGAVPVDDFYFQLWRVLIMDKTDRVFVLIKRLRETTGMSAKEVIGFAKRRGHWPFVGGRNFRNFCNEPVVSFFACRRRGG